MGTIRQSHSVGSLDILLDAITNTFGGVLFLAILVVILLRETSTLPDYNNTPIPDPLELAHQLDTLHANCRALRAELDARELMTKLNDPRLKDMLVNLNSKRKMRDELDQDRAELLLSLSETQSKTVKIAGELGRLDEELNTATDELADAERELEEEKASRQINSTSPRERRATKSEFAVVLKYNRLYEKRERGSFGFAGPPNRNDFFVLGMEGEYLVLSPKPYRGIPLIEDDQLSAGAANTFSGVSPNSYYVAVAIWDDSFAGFHVLRDHLVASGYEYRLVLMAEGDEVFEGHVFDPRVQ